MCAVCPPPCPLSSPPSCRECSLSCWVALTLTCQPQWKGETLPVGISHYPGLP